MEVNNLDSASVKLKISRSENNESDECETNYTLPSSPTCTEKSSNTYSISSKSTRKVPNSLKQKTCRTPDYLKTGGTQNKVYSSTSKSLKDISTSKVESIYNLRKLVRNPITGIISAVVDKTPKSNAPTARKDNISETSFIPNSGAQGDESNLKNLKKHPQIRRNPITGEGLDTKGNQVNNFFRSGIRIQQPPGGLSSNIF